MRRSKSKIVAEAIINNTNEIEREIGTQKIKSLTGIKRTDDVHNMLKILKRKQLIKMRTVKHRVFISVSPYKRQALIEHIKRLEQYERGERLPGNG